MRRARPLSNHLESVPVSQVDLYVRKAWANVLPKKFFNNGYGSFDQLKYLHRLRGDLIDQSVNGGVISHTIPQGLDDKLQLLGKRKSPGAPYRVWKCNLESPALDALHQILPQRSHRLNFQFVQPATLTCDLAWHYGGTGEHFMWRRRSWLGYPLAEQHNTASAIMESVFYGRRRPSDQFGSTLNQVQDLFTMGIALVLETAALQQSFKHTFGLNHNCYSGFSLGGYMAGFATTLLGNDRSSAAPCMSSISASGVFTNGALSSCVDWQQIARQRDMADEFLEYAGATYRRDAYLNSEEYADNALTEDEIRARATLAAVLDEFTSLDVYPRPVCASNVTLVRAGRDAYISVSSHHALAKLWPEATVIEVPEVGHIASFFTSQHIIRKAIASAMQRAHHQSELAQAA
eukprot:TRINITY_DN12026_c0_g2_i2.p3 TRINITY_DN12026_c0_g2~~TRINITY_DN12026_c0_g2_i2.p3  ORF type:complete len:405 (+),score=64.29 TRINITY_DN12026_c0_g2_i2:5369-6583(+)